MLKASYKKKEEIPEGQESLYAEKNGIWVLQVEGMLPKSSIDEFRKNNITLQKQIDTMKTELEKFKDVDPEKYASALETLQLLEEKKLMDAGKMEEVVAQRTERMKKDYDAKLEAATTQATEAQKKLGGVTGKLNTMILESAVVKGISSAASPKKGAIVDIIGRAKSIFSVSDEGAIEAKKDDGTPLFNSESKPFTITDFAADLMKNAGYLFETSTGGDAHGNLNLSPGQSMVSKSQIDGKSVGTDTLKGLASGAIQVTEG